MLTVAIQKRSHSHINADFLEDVKPWELDEIPINWEHALMLQRIAEGDNEARRVGKNKK